MTMHLASESQSEKLARLTLAWREEAHAILQWWIIHMVDAEKGGFYGRRAHTGILEPDADKGVILNTRILWSFALGARFFGNEAYGQMAKRAYEYLLTYFWDEEHRGFKWMLNAKGEATEGKKQVYAQAFGIYSLSEYFLFSGEEKALAVAQEAFQLLEAHSWDEQSGGYLEAFGPAWEPLDDVRLSQYDLNAEKTMNTHLHVLEAYTNLYRAWPDLQLKHSLKRLIRVFVDKFVEAETGHLHLFFDRLWELQSHEISFGHDIEASWLLWEAVEVLGDAELQQELRPLVLKMVEVTLEKGLDPDEGGIWNEADPEGLTDKSKHWWPQAEAMVGCINAWQLSADSGYLLPLESLWEFIQVHLMDRENGEWHWGIEGDGSIMTREKAGPWKAPYHHTRALIEALQRLES